MTLTFEVLKADPIQGIIDLCIGKARYPGEMGDRDGQGFEPASHETAFQWWCDNYGRSVAIKAAGGGQQVRYVGLYDTHGDSIPGRLLHHWYDDATHKGFVRVQPDDRRYAEKAAAGKITCSVGGIARVRKVAA